jgi:hypothetical protein
LLLIAFVILLGAWVRYVFICILHRPEAFASDSDMAEYVARAESLINKKGPFNGFPVSFKPLGYYFFLAFSFGLKKWGLLKSKFAFITWANLLMSLTIPIFLWQACRRWLGEKAALIVLIVGMFHFPFINFAGYIMAEIPFTFLLALLLWGLLAFGYPWKLRHAVILGLIWGLSIIVKGQSLVFGPLAFLAALLPTLLFRRPKSWSGFWPRFWIDLKPTFVAWGVFFASGAIILLSQTLYMSIWTHRFVLLPTVSGVNFLASKMPECRMIFAADGFWVCSPLHHQVGGCGNPRQDCWINAPIEKFSPVAVQAILHDPTRLFAGMRNALFLFTGNEAFPIHDEPNFREINRFYEFFYILFLLPGILVGLLKGMTLRLPVRVRLVLAFAWAAILPYLFISEAEIRYRIPFDVALIPISIWGWGSALGNIRSVRPILRSGFLPYLWIFILAPWMTFRFHYLLNEKGPLSNGIQFFLAIAITALLLNVILLLTRQSDRGLRNFWDASVVSAGPPKKSLKSAQRAKPVNRRRRA